MTLTIFDYKYLKNTIASHGTSPYLKSENESFNFSELYSLATNIASKIKTSNIQNDEVIAVSFSSKLYQVIATWGIIFSENPFFPVNIQSTKERVSSASKNIRYFLTDEPLIAEKFFNKSNLSKKIALRLEFADIYLIVNEQNKSNLFLAKGAFYLMQTSGSTGIPKIVAHSISSAMIFSSWALDYLKLTKADRLISISPLFFDMSIFDIFSSALGGIELCIPEQSTLYFTKDFYNFLYKNNITTIYLTPTLLQKLLSLEKIELKFINKIILAGEDFNFQFLNNLKKTFSNARIYNFYGPTETNVCTYAELTKSDSVVIGLQCPYLKIELAADGEILVAGPTNAIYYIDQDINHDLITIDKLTFYKTGDLATATTQGLKYQGRKDHQLKISGYRVSLIEIENDFQSCFKNSQLKVIYFEHNLYLIFLTDDNTSKDEKMTKIKNELPSHYCPKDIFIIRNKNLDLFSDTFKTNPKKLITYLLKHHFE